MSSRPSKNTSRRTRLATKSRRIAFFNNIRESIRLLRGSLSIPDFTSRWQAVSRQWEADEIPQRTTWQDKKGKTHTFVDYFEKQWVLNNREWFLGYMFLATVPSTNNASESVVKYSMAFGESRTHA